MKLRRYGDPFGRITERPYGESKTIPGQSMQVREILTRYTSGQSLDVTSHTPVYLTDVELYDTRRKHNIDIAVDRLANEENILTLEDRVVDNKTSLDKLVAQSKQKSKNQVVMEPIQQPQQASE